MRPQSATSVPHDYDRIIAASPLPLLTFQSAVSKHLCYNELYDENTVGRIFVSDQSTVVEEIWVSSGEGAEITGYHRDHVQKLARDNWKLPEDQRLIRGIRKRKWGYDILLPDLIKYIETHGHGPFKKNLK